MHCLAKIGHEVSEDVINGHKSIVWEKARNRMIAQSVISVFKMELITLKYEKNK